MNLPKICAKECPQELQYSAVPENCNKFCDDVKARNPQDEYLKFLVRKPVINTVGIYNNLQMPVRFKCQYNFKGYGHENPENPMYRTTSSEYGYYNPTPCTIPARYFPRSQKFSNEWYKFGMYRNYSLNA